MSQEKKTKSQSHNNKGRKGPIKKEKNSRVTIRDLPSSKAITIKPTSPSMERRKDGNMVLKGNDLLQNVTVTGTYNQQVWSLNAENSAIFPRAAPVALSYEKYRFNKLRFHYKPGCPTSTQGALFLGIDYDILDTVPSSSVDITRMTSNVYGSVTASMDLSYDPKQSQIKWFLTRGFPSTSTQFSDPAYLVVRSEAGSNTQQTLAGFLMCEYEIEFEGLRAPQETALSVMNTLAPATGTNIYVDPGVPSTLSDICKNFLWLHPDDFSAYKNSAITVFNTQVNPDMLFSKQLGNPVVQMYRIPLNNTGNFNYPGTSISFTPDIAQTMSLKKNKPYLFGMRGINNALVTVDEKGVSNYFSEEKRLSTISKRLVMDGPCIVEAFMDRGIWYNRWSDGSVTPCVTIGQNATQEDYRKVHPEVTANSIYSALLVWDPTSGTITSLANSGEIAANGSLAFFVSVTPTVENLIFLVQSISGTNRRSWGYFNLLITSLDNVA